MFDYRVLETGRNLLPEKFIKFINDRYFTPVEQDIERYKYVKVAIGTVQDFLNSYWEHVQEGGGIGLAQIDDLFLLLVLIRFLILAFRYNVLTSFVITAISSAAGYAWYSNFLSTAFIYENAFYKTSLTYRLGLDMYQLKRILTQKVQKDGYQIRLSNPVGIIAYAITNASIHDGHRIDFISMAITKLNANLSIDVKVFGRYVGTITKPTIESAYYFMHRRIIPHALRFMIRGYDQLSTYAMYTYMTRVNKRYCPYLLRWHWTMIIVYGFFQTFNTYVTHRMSLYVEMTIIPAIRETDKLYIIVPHRQFELQIFMVANFALVMCQIGFQLYSMYHAVCGQYYYIPFLTENTEMHVGRRDTNSIYSGGCTAWQNPEEKRRSIIPKLWYGWFGRGTKTAIIPIGEFIFEPLFYFIRKFLRFGRKER